MNQPTHRDKAESYLQRAEVASFPAALAALASIAAAHAVLAHLDAVPARCRCVIKPIEVDSQVDQGAATSGRDDHAGGAVPGADVAAVAVSAPVPVSRDAGNGSGDLRADLVEQIATLVLASDDAGLHPVEAGCERCVRARAGARNLLEEGWRPPLPDGGRDLAEQVACEIRRKLDWHQWPGCDWTNSSLSEITDVALAGVMPFLDEPPAARVFFPGDTVPAGVTVLDETGGGGRRFSWDWPAEHTYVEAFVPTGAEWQAAVDQAHAERHEAGFRQFERDLEAAGPIDRARAEREQSTSDTTGQETDRA